ncbi:MAG: sulfurtransferase-like selenium metabolism protein YedF [Clostridiales Family XIII bacterium]|jgi:selenium metabolism protein YedF|nr:sulfurtransferase-like selenium metabolism protein YedF [Clostridiales Family XIII bacterium]
MKTIDMTGKACPAPVVEARKVLTGGEDGVVVIVDNAIAVSNLKKLAASLGCGARDEQRGEAAYIVTIAADGAAAAPPLPLTPAAPPVAPGDGDVGVAPGLPAASGDAPGLVVWVPGNRIGFGAEDLGETLLGGFLYALTELPETPSHVIFMNAGAFLTAEGSSVLDDLLTLAGKGAKVLTCGACHSYYGLEGRLAVGEITNMYHITELLAGARRLIRV